MESKICSLCSFGKIHQKSFQIFADCKVCNNKRGLKRYYDNKDRKSNRIKVYKEKNKDIMLQQQNDRYIHFKDLVRRYVELEKD